jgi:hypothetical protein
MERLSPFVAAFSVTAQAIALPAQPIAVRHIQRPMYRFMLAPLRGWETIASAEFTRVVQGDKVAMRLTYRVIDGSIDHEATTYTQHGNFG